MSVNVSPKQLEGDGFHAVVREALHRSRLPARNLWLEVTESSMIDDPEQALRTLEQLADLGVRVAWTTSVPDTRRCRCCSGSHSSASRSTGRS